MKASRVLTIFAYVWFGLASSVIVIGYLGIVYKSGFWELQRILSPFNVWNFLAVLITLSPGIGALALAKKLERKQ